MSIIVNYSTAKLISGDRMTNRSIIKVISLRMFLRSKILRMNVMSDLNSKEAIEKLNNLSRLFIQLNTLKIVIHVDYPPDPRFAPLIERVINISKDTLYKVKLIFEGNEEIVQDISKFLYPLRYCTKLHSVKLIGDKRMNCMIQLSGISWITKAERLKKLWVTYFIIVGNIKELIAINQIKQVYFDMNDLSEYKEQEFVQTIDALSHSEFNSLTLDVFSYYGPPPYISYLKLVEGSFLLQYEITSSVIQQLPLPIDRVCQALAKNRTLQMITIYNDQALKFENFEKPIFHCLESHLVISTIKLRKCNMLPVTCPPKLKHFHASSCEIVGGIFVRPPYNLESLIIENGIFNLFPFFNYNPEEDELGSRFENLKYLKIKNNYLPAMLPGEFIEAGCKYLFDMHKITHVIITNNFIQFTPRLDLPKLISLIFIKAIQWTFAIYFPPINLNLGFNICFDTTEKNIPYVSKEFSNELIANPTLFSEPLFIYLKVMKNKVIKLLFEINQKVKLLNPYLLLIYSKLERFGIVGRNIDYSRKYERYFTDKTFVTLLSQGLEENQTLKSLIFQWTIQDQEIIIILLGGMRKMVNLLNFELYLSSDYGIFQAILLFITKNRSLVRSKLIFSDDAICMRNIIDKGIISLLLKIRSQLFLCFPQCSLFNTQFHIEERNPAIHFLKEKNK